LKEDTTTPTEDMPIELSGTHDLMRSDVKNWKVFFADNVVACNMV
jgi:hypothetical protein